jgi:hypothetical protein
MFSIAGFRIIGVKPRREHSENALNGLGLSIRADLHQFIVVNELVSSHASGTPL